MVSTANDMANWLIMQQNLGEFKATRLLSSDGVKTMHSVPINNSSHYGMGWTVADKNEISHNGILWTFSSDQFILTNQGYGVVVLFNSGLNPLVDYSSFSQGIKDILLNIEPSNSIISNIFLEVCLGILSIITIIIGVRSLCFIRNWEEKFRKRKKWGVASNLILTVIPFAIFISFPKIMTSIAGGRVLSWERIYLAMPSLSIWLALAAIFSIIITVIHLIRLIHHR